MNFSDKHNPLLFSIKKQKKNKEFSLMEYQEGYRFYQTITTYPCSSFALGLATILKDILKKDCTSQNTLSELFDTYMQKVGGFSSLNLLLISSLFSHAKKHIDNWAEYQKIRTYYLYSPCNQPESVKDKLFPDLLGVLELVKIAAPLEGGKKYRITFYPQKKRSLTVQYEQGQLYTKGLTTFYLQPTYIPKRYLTSNPKDHSIIPILIGEINGRKVLGTQIKQDLSSETESSLIWPALWYPLHFLQWIHLLTRQMAITNGIKTLVECSAFIYKNLYKKITSSFTQELLYQEFKNLSFQLHKQIQIKISESSRIESEIFDQRISLATLLAFQEGLIQKDNLEKKATQLEQYIQENNPIKNKETINFLSSAMHEIISAVSQAFQPADITSGLEKTIQNNKYIMKEIYQNLTIIHTDLITHFTEKKEVS